MPRLSKKRRVEIRIEKACRFSENIMAIRKIYKDDEEVSEQENESSDSDYSILHELINQSYSFVSNLQYLFRDKYRMTEKWYNILYGTHPDTYSDTEFFILFPNDKN